MFENENLPSTLDSSTQTEFFPAQGTKNENIENAKKAIADLKEIFKEDKTYKVYQNTNKVDNSTQTEPFSLTDHKKTIKALRESMDGLEKTLHK